MSWATFQGLKDNENLMDYWDSVRGIALIPYNKLPEKLNTLLEGAYLDVDSLPADLKGLNLGYIGELCTCQISVFFVFFECITY